MKAGSGFFHVCITMQGSSIVTSMAERSYLQRRRKKGFVPILLLVDCLFARLTLHFPQEVIHMNKERLGTFISDCRRELGLTQQELAEQVHVTNKAVSKWERGLSYPDVTLLEPLASALGLRVEELMACRRRAIPSGEEDPMKNLLTISDDSLRRERRRSWGRVGAVLALVIAAALVIAYSALYVTETRTQELVLKETVDGVNYFYLQEGDHLLKLRCEGNVDFDGTPLKNERGKDICYRMDCRWNRLTHQGTVTACAATAQFSIGSTMDQVGGAVGLDYNPETGDALFGYYDATFEYRHIYPYPIGDGFLFTYNFWRGDGKTWNTELLLTVKDCLTFAAVDWDGDGVTELLVRTRWPEKPYTVYDMVDGSVTETWPDTLDPEFTEHLLTASERQERLQEQLRREGVDLETERAASDDFVL